ncbi:dihydropteroate synthase [Iodidimonas muriae]|nr:dihydropteroate synthase [Iodidimonas muriae]
MRMKDASACQDSEFLLKPVAPALVAGAPFLPLAGGPYGFSRLLVTLLDGDAPVAMEQVSVGQLAEWRADLDPALLEKFDSRLTALTAPRPPMTIPGRAMPLGFGRPMVMGIVNVTPDSFSDGGRFSDVDAALAHGQALIDAGADILDIGGESTRPGAKPVWEEEERQRIVPVIEGLAKSGAVLSVDTRKASVMEAALEAGAHIINDISALTYDDRALAVAAASDAPVILMHAKGTPQTMQDAPVYDHVLAEIYIWLLHRIAACEAAGLGRERLMVDPGIGFGKTVRHNLDVINGLGALHSLGVPQLLGVSRKRFIGALSAEEPAGDRLGGSLAAGLAGLGLGVQILRVHDVRETVQAVRVLQGLAASAVMEQGIDAGR